MSWVGQLQAQREAVEREQSTKPDATERPMRDVLRRLRGRRGPHGTEWLTSDEIAHRLGMRPGDKLRPVWAKVHPIMIDLGWRAAIVGTGRVRARGFVRPIPLPDTASPSPHHGEAVAAILDALRGLAPLGLSGADLDRAWDAARDALAAATGPTAPVPPSAPATPSDRAEGIGPVPDPSTRPAGPGTATPPMASVRPVRPTPAPTPTDIAAFLDALGPSPAASKSERRQVDR